MARTIQYWYDQIIAEKNNQPGLAGITSTSKVSIFALLGWVFAFVAWLMDNQFDMHTAENKQLIDAEKAHQSTWYRTQALAFQYGQEYNRDKQQYDNTGLTDEQIEAQKLVAQAAVTEVDGRLRIKVAREVAGDLSPLSDEQLTAFAAYIEKVKDAGVKIDKDSLPPDSLKLMLDIFYDPLILRGDGSRIDGNSNTPVPDAIREYLRELPFNGEYANSRLMDKLQSVQGVVLPVVKASFAKYGLFPFGAIDERYIPDAGYLRLADADLTINYRQYV